MAPDPRWLTEADVVRLLSLPEAVDAVEAGLVLETSGGAQTMDKTQVVWGEGHTLHAIGAEVGSAGVVGTKSWAHTEGGATPLLVLWDSATGALVAIVEAFALGQLRTAAVSGVATRYLASADADELAVIGTGKQALPQVAAVAAVRRLRRVRAFSPNPDRRAAFVQRLEGAGLGVDVTEAASVADAVAGCPIITAVTRARSPFLHASMVEPGTHINAVGAISPERRELTADLVARADLVVADSPATARRLTAELAEVAEIVALSAVVAAGRGRPAGTDLTLFKAMGIGLADVAVGVELLRRAADQGVGRRFPHPERATPRLQGGSP